MGPLYARYIPPKLDSQTLERPLHGIKVESRVPSSIAEVSKKRKRGNSTQPGSDSKLEGRKEIGKVAKNVNATAKSGTGESDQGKRLRGAESPNKHGSRSGSSSLTHDQNKSSYAVERGRKGGHEKAKRRGHEETQAVGIPEAQSVPSKHASILSKYEKSTKQPLSDHASPERGDGELEDEQDEVRALVPIPFPKRHSQGPAFSAQSALPLWLSNPITVPKYAVASFKNLGICPSQVDKLCREGFEPALAVQAGVLPLLLPTSTQHPGDLCVSATTGSGKTLAYVIPIVQDLSKKSKSGLRALIVVPTRELVNQVRETVDLFIVGTELKVGVATGAQHLQEEQSGLVKRTMRYDPAAYQKHQLQRDQKLELQSFLNRIDDDLGAIDDTSTRTEQPLAANFVPEYRSRIDILICTPGRLVDHIKRTEGFDLTSVEWMIVDEADRLLDASFQEWVEVVNMAMHASSLRYEDSFITTMVDTGWRRSVRKVVLSATMTKDLQKLAGLKLKNPRLLIVEGFENPETDTNEFGHDVTSALGLPSRLAEYGVPVGDGSDKPLHLLCLLDKLLGLDNRSKWPKLETKARTSNHGLSPESPGHTKHGGTEDDLTEADLSSESSESSGGSSDSSLANLEHGPGEAVEPSTRSNALIFTSSNESAHRLAHLFKHLRPTWSQLQSTLTKSGTSSSTGKTISDFRSGTLRVVIATERASRGLDIPNLENVINYDIPHGITSYVHRVGRTARAGKAGFAWTMVEDKQARWFWKEVAKGKDIDRGIKGVKRMRMNVEELRDEDRQGYASALAALEHDVRGSR